MCEEIGILAKDGSFVEWCGDIKELVKYCPKGLWTIFNRKVDPCETYMDKNGKVWYECDMCLCNIDHYQTAFVNGYLYSHIDPDGDPDGLCGYYRPQFTLV